MFAVRTRIDFTQPLHAPAPRLRPHLGAVREVLQAHALDEVRAVLDAVQQAASQGLWCVGFVRYEAAAAFDAALRTHDATGPLAWFAVHAAPLTDADADADAAAAYGDSPSDAGGQSAVLADGNCSEAAQPARLQWHEHSQSRSHFNQAVGAIHAAIAAGEVYQINHTAQLHGQLHGSPEALFARLQQAQPGGYAAFIDTGDEQILSVSPELFFDWRDGGADGGQILARPMKGTAPRGVTPEQDAALAEALRSAPKERAENVMIVDLLRNDLSRIAQPHSVQVPALFATQALPTVWQMTSDVRARTRVGTTLTDIFTALFPCGSVTGAPKVRAMQMIEQLEGQPRGVYCGAVGVVRPAGGVAPATSAQLPAVGTYPVAATFNVPIRTVVLTPNAAQGVNHFETSCGIGSGITSGAQADAEWAEWQHKRAFVLRAGSSFDIVETLALQDGRFEHAALHVRRMGEAASHFGYPCNEHALRQELQITALHHLDGHWRVRLLLQADGQSRIEAFALNPTAEPVQLQLAEQPFAAAHSEFVRFKTTQRAHYEAFAPRVSGVFDTLLWNVAGEITESTFGNVAALIDGRWVTPRLECGLLPGVGRAVALRNGTVVEGVVRLSDVPRVQGWAFINSLRGWLTAQVAVPEGLEIRAP